MTTYITLLSILWIVGFITHILLEFNDDVEDNDNTYEIHNLRDNE